MDAPTNAAHLPTDEHPPLWIDELPLDICARIVSILNATSQMSALGLQVVSPTQCAAVKEAFSYRISLRSHTDFQTDFQTDYSEFDVIKNVMVGKTWAVAALRNDAREIRLSGFQLYDPFCQPYFSCPVVTKLVIDDLPRAPGLNLPPLADSVRVLELRLANVYGIIPLLRSISSPNLRDLKLETTERTCLHGILNRDPANECLLSEGFPNVEKLQLGCGRCQKRIPGSASSSLWRAIDGFSKLKDVTLTESVPEEAVEKLQHMNRVTVIEGNVLELVSKIPNRLVGVVRSRAWCEAKATQFTLTDNHLRQFGHCTRLESLDCCIKRGTEDLLVPIMKQLRSLGLAFEYDADSDNPVRRVLNPAKGALLNAVKGAPFLKSIRLVNMRIGRDELQEILVVLGPQLEEFREQVITGHPIHQFAAHILHFHPGSDRGKFEMRELIATLRTAALHNTSLRRFKIDKPCAMHYSSNSTIRADEYELERALDLLARRAPHLHIWETKDIRRSVRIFNDKYMLRFHAAD